MLNNYIKDNEYILMYKGDEIGVLSYDGVDYNLHVTNHDLLIGEYPPVWDKYPVIDTYEPCSKKKLKEFVESKVVPKCRAQELLNHLGLDSYDIWEITKHTRGITTDDYWWFAKPGDDYNEWHPRAYWDKGLPWGESEDSSKYERPVPKDMRFD